MNKSNEMIPFGKYRGQPVEKLLEDQKYIDWLKAQPWLEQQYPQFHTLIINNFKSDNEDSPEHNVMQLRFLDERFALGVVLELYGGFTISGVKKIRAELSERLITRLSILEKKRESDLQKAEEKLKAGGREFNDFAKSQALESVATHSERWEQELTEETRYEVKFEESGWDLVILGRYESSADLIIPKKGAISASDKKENVGWKSHIFRAYVELKPTIGEDFPQILRTVTARKMGADLSPSFGERRKKFVIAGEFTAKSGTFDQGKEMYATKNIGFSQASEFVDVETKWTAEIDLLMKQE